MHSIFTRSFFSFLLATACSIVAKAQCPIDSLGQNPSTAFPVCGTGSFEQKQVNLCGGKTINSPKCNSGVLQDVNPYWYKFTCFESGTLGFTIRPNSTTSDYDWQVFDITGRDPEAVFANAAAWSVSSNWSQYFGNTGTTATAGNVFECEGPVPQFSKMPQIIKGHEYILLVSHFSNTQAGYKLDFGGGTGSITDTTKPHLQTLDAFCDGRSLRIKLNKKMRCTSVAANGSDFQLIPSPVGIIAAQAVGCNPGFDTDSIVLTLSGPLPVGSYDLMTKVGNDGNTMLDFCGTPLPENEQLNVQIIPLVPSPMDSMIPVLCKPDVLRLVFNKPMLCNTVAANGSDFTVSGPSAVTVVGASGAACVNGTSKVIEIKLASPIKVAGQYTILLHTGTDGNTVLNECQKETLVGSTLQFTGYDSVSPRIDYVINSSCIDDTLHVSNAGGNGINSWSWLIDNGAIRTRQLEDKVFSNGMRTVKLTVSNGVCTDSSQLTIDFDKNRVKAFFTSPQYVCPFDTARFTDTSTGPVTGWKWDFGNGQTSTSEVPPYQFYPNIPTLQQYTIRLVVNAANGCEDSASHTVIVPGNCYIAVPTAFTPDGDGLNDYLYPLSAYKATNLSFKVYNRYGKKVWETTDWTRKWDGRINGNPQASGTYVWYLSYTDDKNVPVKLQGTTTLIR
jgi:gliding motility-associated-like protein